MTGCGSDFCYEPVPRLQIAGVPYGVFSTDGDRAWFFIYMVYARHARGICRFPDGGGAIISHEFADFFELDLARRRLTHLASFPGSDAFALSSTSGSYGFSHMGKGRLYAHANGRPRGSLTPSSREGLEALRRSRFFELVRETGEVREIDELEYAEHTRGLPRSGDAATDRRGHRVVLGRDFEAQGTPAEYSFQRLPPPQSEQPPETLITGLDWIPHDIEYILWGPEKGR